VLMMKRLAENTGGTGEYPLAMAYAWTSPLGRTAVSFLTEQKIQFDFVLVCRLGLDPVLERLLGSHVRPADTEILAGLKAAILAERIAVVERILQSPGFVPMGTLKFLSNELKEPQLRGVNLVIAMNANITEINLDNNGVVGESADGLSNLCAAMQTNTNLKRLNLGRNNIGDSGAALLSSALETNATLTHLLLDNNYIGDSGASAFAAALQKNSSLTHLSLSSNCIGDAGAASLASAVQTNVSLVELTVEGNKICSEGSSAFNSAILAVKAQGRGLFIRQQSAPRQSTA